MFREIRRKDRLASTEAGIALLNSCEYGVLSVIGDDDYPYGIPVNFAYQDNCIYIHGFLKGHKIDAIEKHSKVCFTAVEDAEVMKDQVATNFTSVIVFGKAELIPPPENAEREKGFAAIIDKYVPNEAERTTAYIRENEANTNLIKIKIEHMTCKQRSTK